MIPGVMNVRQIMSSKPVTVEMDDSLRTVKEIFDHLHFHHLVVVEEGRLYGVISDRDLLKALSPNLGTAAESSRDAATLNKRVHQVMTRKPITLHPDASLMEAINVFNTHRISCIPIVDHEHRPVGLLSWRDIFRSMQRPAGQGGEPAIDDPSQVTG
jgi:acetoin utilization protein AcuB